MDASITTLDKAVSPISLLDFEKTEILAGSPVQANGSAQLVVVVHLKNSDHSSVPGYKPTYNVTSSAGINAAQCTTSDSNGISVCIVKSVSPGVKNFILTNAKVGLSENIEFTHPQGAQKLALVSGSQINVGTPQNSKLQITTGNAIQGVRRQTAGGYKITFSMQGVTQ